MSLDVYLTAVRPTRVHSGNITHNLVPMAEEAGIYQHLWRPEELGISKAGGLIGPLSEGLAKLLAEPEKYKVFNPENGWGDYDGLVQFAHEYLRACCENPDAEIEVSR